MTAHSSSVAAKMQAAQPRFAVLPPRSLAEPVLDFDSSQNSVLDLAPGHGPQLLWGGPGTGKTSVALQLALNRVRKFEQAPESLVLISASRQLAAQLRDRLSTGLNRSLRSNPVRTWSAWAFELLRKAHLDGITQLDPAATPRLISGPEQDLIIAEILSGHRELGVKGPKWPESLNLALGTRGFRQELRELFDRVNEYGLAEEELAELGRAQGYLEWEACAALFAEYRDVVELRMPGGHDPVVLMRRVINLLEDYPDWRESVRSELSLVLVDDLQEASRTGFDLLKQLTPGKDALFTAAPDVVVQGFRGARPDRIADLTHTLHAQETILERSYRLTDPLNRAWRAVTERIGVAGSSAYRQFASASHQSTRTFAGEPGSEEGKPAEAEVETSVSVHVVSSTVQQWRFIAEKILALNLEKNVPFSEIAVILPHGAAVEALARHLLNTGIPVTTPRAEVPLNQEPAVRGLLLALDFVTRPEAITGSSVEELLSSRLGGMNSLQLRRLRQQLRAEGQNERGDRYSSDEHLAEAIFRPAELEILSIEGKTASRIARALNAGIKAQSQPGGTAQTVLWAIWAATGLSAEWEALAVSDRPQAALADRDLDAMVALFQAAERFVDRSPGASGSVFLDFVNSQELPMDSLATLAQHEQTVHVLTPASAAGQQWEVVILGGLEEGNWPNTRLRGQLLGGQTLVDILELGPGPASDLSITDRIIQVRHDELRSLAAALSRSSRELICVGTSSEDEQPSSFLEIIEPWDVQEGSQRPLTVVNRPQNLRQLVAELRRVGEASRANSSQHKASEVAAVLAYLAVQGIDGAAPDQWWGLLPLSSTAPLFEPDSVIPLSPSKIEQIHGSPFDWCADQGQGQTPSTECQQLGNLIHQLAQNHPELNLEDLRIELEQRLGELDLPAGWQSEVIKSRAETMIHFLAQYGIKVRAEGRTLVAAEQGFGVEITGDRTSRLSGMVDRLEKDAEGRWVVIDFKTGRSIPTKEQLATHLQIGAYQAAVLNGAFDHLEQKNSEQVQNGGAQLVQLGSQNKTVGISEQEVLTEESDWVTPIIQESAVAISSAEFLSIHDSHQNTGAGHPCRLPSVCPLCHGEQVTE